MHTGLFAYGTLLQGNWYTPWLATPMKYRYSYNIVWQGLNFLTALWVLFTKILVNIISADSKLSQWEALTTKFALSDEWAYYTEGMSQERTHGITLPFIILKFAVVRSKSTLSARQSLFLSLSVKKLLPSQASCECRHEGFFLSSDQISCLNQS